MKHPWRWIVPSSALAVFLAWSGLRADEAATRRQEQAARAALTFTKGDWPEAQKLYEDLLRGDPNNAPMLANLGAVEFQLADFAAAIGYLEKALQRQPDLEQPRETLGMAYLRVGKPYHALSVLARLAGDRPLDHRAHNQLAVALQELGWHDGAEKSLLRAVDLNPNFADAHFNLALLYLDQEKPALELARQHYQKARVLGAKRDAEVEKRLGL